MIAGAVAFFVLTVNAAAGALLDAVKTGDLSEAETAISQGADVNEKTGFLTPLIAAILATRYEMAAILLDHGADPNKGAGSNIPLFMASGMKDGAFVQLLLEKGADARLTANNMTALHRAAEAGCLKCAELLIAAGADVNALTFEATPPAIHLAKLAGHEEIVALLMARGYEPPRLKPISPALKSANATNGKSVFDKACATCHRLTQTLLAAPLEGVVGRPKASMAGQKYSEALRAAGGNWTYEDLNTFIANPGASVPGTSMSFWGVPDDGERADLILYLRNQSADPKPLP
ncbi:MAG: ankyrin repeat domain-containing protein [Rhizobiaceae bacterium]